MDVAIVRYNAGNIGSVTNALKRLGLEPSVTDDAEELRAADRVIFPGVGEASGAMASLRAAGLDRVIPELENPVLGICLGMQLLCERSDENSTQCLGVVQASVRAFVPDGIKVPHMGWNSIRGLDGRLFEGIDEGAYVYFVHGFFVEAGPFATATSDHGGEFTAALKSRNFLATQFHPEKSGPAGERILKNFIKYGAE